MFGAVRPRVIARVCVSPVWHASCGGPVARAGLLPPRDGRELRSGAGRGRRREVIYGTVCVALLIY